MLRGQADGGNARVRAALVCAFCFNFVFILACYSVYHCCWLVVSWGRAACFFMDRLVSGTYIEYSVEV